MVLRTLGKIHNGWEGLPPPEKVSHPWEGSQPFGGNTAIRKVHNPWESFSIQPELVTGGGRGCPCALLPNHHPMSSCSVGALRGPGSSLCPTLGAGAGIHLLQGKGDPFLLDQPLQPWNGIHPQEFSSIPGPPTLSDAGDTVASPARASEGPCGTSFIPPSQNPPWQPVGETPPL